VTLRRIALCGLAIAFALLQPVRMPTAPSKGVDRAAAIARVRALPLAFEENRGQTSAPATFVARGQGYAMWATSSGPIIKLSNASSAATVRLRAVGARPAVAAIAEAPLSGRANYFRGNDPSRWITGVRRYGVLRYENVYDGIDLVLHGSQQALEYDFEVAAGVDPSAIAVAFDGVDRVRLEDDGDLTLIVADADLRFHQPVAYQSGAEGREFVEARYQLSDSGAIRFVLGEYDRDRPLVIDPVIDYSTYLGGAKTSTNGIPQEDAYGVAVDAAGNAYLTGFTSAIDFPMQGAPFDNTCGGCTASGGDAFVAKIDPSQSGAASLIFTTYLGSPGNMSSVGNGVAVDQDGAVYVTGWTNAFDNASTPINDAFPTTLTAFQPDDGGDLAMADAFLTKLDANGSSLLYSSYIGGNNVDEGYTVRVDGAGHAYVAGRSASAAYTAVKNGFQMTNKGVFDAFVVKVDTLGAGAASLMYGTLFGGSGSDNTDGMAIDAQGRVYITGDTQSGSGAAVPLTIRNGFQPTAGAGQHAFMAMIDPSIAGVGSLVYSTYAGTTGTEGASLREGGIAVDGSGMVYMAGTTFGGGFPTTVGVIKTTVQGSDAYVVKIDPSQIGAASLVASTLFGGSFNDNAAAMTVDNAGNPVLAGYTESSNLPTSSCALPKANNKDAFVAILTPDLTGIVYSTFLGGAGADFGQDVAIGPTGAIYLAGGTDSTNFPTTANAFDTTHQVQCNGCGSHDAFLTRITSPVCPAPPIAFGSAEEIEEDKPKAITLKASDTGGLASPPDTLTWTITTPPQHGSLDISNGTMTHSLGAEYSTVVIYSPFSNYDGPDSFQFRVNDGTFNSNIATVTLTIRATNDDPIANPDTATTAEDTPVTVAVLANDTDPDGDALKLMSVGCEYAVPSINDDNTVTVYPALNFTGTLECQYTMEDIHHAWAHTTLHITYTPVNDGPDGNPDVAGTMEDQPVAIEVLQNDTDVDGDTLTIDSATCNVGTPVLIANNRQIEYTPPPNFNGSDHCFYIVVDGNGGGDGVDVDVTVSPVNDLPVAQDDVATTPEDVPVTIPVLLNDSDADGDALNIAAAPVCVLGTPIVNGDGTMTVHPPLNYHGNIGCSYKAGDGNGGIAIASVSITVTPVNDPPVAAGDSAATLDTAPISIDVLANDTDIDGDALSIGPSYSCSNGSISVNPDNTILYTPPAGYGGLDACQYVVIDNHGGADTGLLAVTVTHVVPPPPPPNNQPPVCSAAAPSVMTLMAAEDTFVPIDILGVVDPDGETPVISITRILQDEATDTSDPLWAIDGSGIGTPTASVRAERITQKKLNGDGRVYEIRFTARDAAAASCTGVVFVTVPKNKKEPAVDSGERYDSTIATPPPATFAKGQ